MSKSRQNSNIPNRLSVADRTELLTKTGTREGEVILQRDIGLLYAWTDTQGVDNGGTIVNVGTGSWLAQYDGAVNVKWFGAVGDGTSPYTSQTTVSGNQCIGGTGYIHGILVDNIKPFINGYITTTTTTPTEITIPTKTYAAGQAHYGTLSLTGATVGDLVVLSPKTTSEVTPGIVIIGTVNATNQIRWVGVNATTGSIVEPERIYLVSLIKNI